VLFLAALPFIAVAALYVLFFAGWVPILGLGLLIVSNRWPLTTIDGEIVLGLGLSAFGAAWGMGVLVLLAANEIEKSRSQPPALDQWPRTVSEERWRWVLTIGVFVLLIVTMVFMAATGSQ
jgi:hypothetical protein